MSINFEKIPSAIEVSVPSPLKKTRTVPEELKERQQLLKGRSIKCENIQPFYVKIKKPSHRFYYKYFCVCPRYKPQYVCKHTGNIIVDRDALTKKEHIYYLATPRANLAAPRQMPHYFCKKTLIANCTDRIIRLAKPDLRQVTSTLNKFNGILSRRQKRSLEKRLEKSPDVEYTSIQRALELISEEKRLKRVARRKERLRCQMLSRKIFYRQKQQIRKIIAVLFEEMKEFLLNDQLATNDNSTLETVILEALREFADNDFNMTIDLREYQKILAFNLAIWINGFMSNLNIHVSEQAPPQQYTEKSQTQMGKDAQELTTFLPVGDYVLHSSGSEDNYQDDDDANYYPFYPKTSDTLIQNNKPDSVIAKK